MTYELISSVTGHQDEEQQRQVISQNFDQDCELGQTFFLLLIASPTEPILNEDIEYVMFLDYLYIVSYIVCIVKLT